MIDYTAMAERLSGEYRHIFEKTELYSDMNGIEEDVKADKMMNLLDLLMTAEAEGKPADAVIGTDIRQFCREYFKEEQSVRRWLWQIPETLYRLALALGLVFLLDLLLWEEKRADPLHMQLDIVPFAGGMLLGAMLVLMAKYVLGPLIFRSRKIPPIVFYILILVLFAGGVGFATIWIEDGHSIFLPAFPILVADVSYIAGYLVIRSILRYRHTGSIRKPKLLDGEFELHIRPVDGEDRLVAVDQEIQEVLVKRFQNMNKRRRKKQKPVLTTQEYIAKIRRGDAKVPYMIWGLGIFYIFLIVRIVWDTVGLSGIGWGTLLCIAFGLVIYIPLFLFIRHFAMAGVRERAEILKEWEEHGIILNEIPNEIPKREIPKG